MSRDSFYKLKDQFNDDSFILEDLIRFLPEHKVDEFVEYFRRQNNIVEELEIEEYEDEDGDTVYVIPGIEFTGNVPLDMKQLNDDPQIYDWLYGNLGSDEAVTDSKMLIVYGGADVQDYLD